MTETLEAVRAEPSLPSLDSLAEDFWGLVDRSKVAARCLDASSQGVFRTPDGSEAPLTLAHISPAALAFVAHLSRACPTDLSIDIGFGMGMSVAMALAARADLGHSFRHIAFDPWGLGADGTDGDIVQQYLEAEFGDSFQRIWKPSQIGMAQLLDSEGYGCAGYVFIDGGHTFEQVMVDFSLADHLCCLGGHIVFDDANFPAIETVVEYVRANRSDYAVWHQATANTSILRKISYERPAWDSFEPFAVATRRNWTSCESDWNGSLPPPRR